MAYNGANRFPYWVFTEHCPLKTVLFTLTGGFQCFVLEQALNLGLALSVSFGHLLVPVIALLTTENWSLIFLWAE